MKEYEDELNEYNEDLLELGLHDELNEEEDDNEISTNFFNEDDE